jgi:NAD(P)-dependent dehydrogenase (short-subunit alcohol dehydrogenase family)
MRELAGKVAVVTGAASGIGSGLARALSAERMRVVLADIEPGALAEVAEALASEGHEVEAVVTDVADWEQVRHLADRAIDRFGAVHVLCNNAGVLTSGPAWEQSLDDWRWVLGVDLWSVVHGVRAFVPVMLDQGGPAHVVNTASVAGLMGYPRSAPYSAAKFAVVGLSETLHHDLRAAGAEIGVSVLCPGSVPTRISQSARNRPGATPSALDIPTQRQPPPTSLTPDEVAAKVVAAIRTDRFWVLSHPEYGDLVLEHARWIVDGTAPTPPPTF